MQSTIAWKVTRSGCKWIGAATLLCGACGCEDITGIKDFSTLSPPRSDASADAGSGAGGSAGDGSEPGADSAAPGDGAMDGTVAE